MRLKVCINVRWTHDSLILLWLTRPFGVVEVSFHDPAGFAVTAADAAPVFFCSWTDDAVTADFLQEVEEENKKTKKCGKKIIVMNEFVHVDCEMSFQTCMLFICLHNTKRSSSHSSKTKPNTPKFLGSNGLYLVDTVSSIDYFIY